MTATLDDMRDALPDLGVRPPRYVDGVVHRADLDAAEALLAACDIAAVGERDSGRDEVAGMFSSSGTDRELSALVHDGDDLVGFVWIEHNTEAEETWIDVYADPARPSDRIIAAGLRHGLAVARDDMAAAGAASWTARSGSFGTDLALVSGLEAAGFACVRRFYRMRIDLTTAPLPEVAPALPAGVVISVARTDEERRRVHVVQRASFPDHWNHTPRSYEDFLERLGLEGQDPDGWWLLEVEGEPAALCILDDTRADLGDGYVRTLGVAPQFRGRGLAQLLLERAFVRYRDLGRAGVQLSVDSTSPTGADRLYRKVGMQVVRELDAWAHPL